eukprot:CAMPEP_0173094324 /NCGR_PEP_ID=MMETSP1102-20130122/30850_1 /TAXON_ID=49646 /ORGANISM="Geminigera sp., Strain Caron Lab Isolate" /LENGTH=95 /DNA_ID=CAMNT_0013983173 /DNA_START=30 /DNA_END=317 /DNA_ORIENTATION=+
MDVMEQINGLSSLRHERRNKDKDLAAEKDASVLIAMSTKVDQMYSKVSTSFQELRQPKLSEGVEIDKQEEEAIKKCRDDVSKKFSAIKKGMENTD